MSNKFYLRDTRNDVGSNAIFWNKDGAGYGSNLDLLHVYTLEEAQRYHNSRKTDVPLLKSLVDEYAVWRVDHQYIKKELLNKPDQHDQYVVVVNDYVWGNDVGFLTDGEPTYDFKQAKIFTKQEIDKRFPVPYLQHSYSIYALSDIEKLSRRTFPARLFNFADFCVKAGIKPVKPKRKRATMGKTRGNCPVCGRITWDFNPYENAYCADHSFEDTPEYARGLVGRGMF